MNPLQKAIAWAAQKTGIAGAEAWLRGDDVMDAISQDRLTNPFAHSVWVQRAIKSVAEPISSTPLDLFTLAGKERREITDPNLMEFWEAPKTP